MVYNLILGDPKIHYYYKWKLKVVADRQRQHIYKCTSCMIYGSDYAICQLHHVFLISVPKLWFHNAFVVVAKQPQKYLYQWLLLQITTSCK